MGGFESSRQMGIRYAKIAIDKILENFDNVNVTDFYISDEWLYFRKQKVSNFMLDGQPIIYAKIQKKILELNKK